MTSRSVSPPTPEPERDEAHSAQIAEMRGRAERVLADLHMFYGEKLTGALHLLTAALASDVIALTDQVAELRSALETIATSRADSPEMKTALALYDATPYDWARLRARQALARLASFASALPEGSVTPEERRTRAGELT